MAKGRKTGGRVKGTPNKEKPLKRFLHQHSLSYFEVDEQTGRSRFDEDMEQLRPSERVDAEIKLLNYHTAKMQSTTVEVGNGEGMNGINARIRGLMNGKHDKSEASGMK